MYTLKLLSKIEFVEKIGNSEEENDILTDEDERSDKKNPCDQAFALQHRGFGIVVSYIFDTIGCIPYILR